MLSERRPDAESAVADLPRLSEVPFRVLSMLEHEPLLQDAVSNFFVEAPLDIGTWVARALEVLDEAALLGARVAVYGAGLRANGLLRAAMGHPSLVGFVHGQGADRVEGSGVPPLTLTGPYDWLLVSSRYEEEIAHRLSGRIEGRRLVRLVSSDHRPVCPAWLLAVQAAPSAHAIILGEGFSALLRRIVAGARLCFPALTVTALVVESTLELEQATAPIGGADRSVVAGNWRRFAQMVQAIPVSCRVVAVAGNDSRMAALVRLIRPGTAVYLHDIWTTLEAGSFPKEFAELVATEQAAERVVVRTPGLLGHRAPADRFAALFASLDSCSATFGSLPDAVVPTWCRPVRARRSGPRWRIVWAGSVGADQPGDRGDPAFDFEPLFRRLVNADVEVSVYASHRVPSRYRTLAAESGLFRLCDNTEISALAALLGASDFGLNYMMPGSSRMSDRHFRVSYGVRLYTFVEAGIPLIVSRSHTHLAEVVEREGIGIVVSWDALERLPAVLDELDYAAFAPRIEQFRQRHNCAETIRQLLATGAEMDLGSG